ncbi:hypothetical protein GOBAR_AA04798 [Gossypium barbadense]|uniref:SWIM-type domain-containing protein n=1 Tax=Gossypium barbadense TaxID=3634 RepID=A0A2P5YJL6_GOSBA|nr:hypothetical protein GOBAR_AA04798 [Gossypium barbadense]
MTRLESDMEGYQEWVSNKSTRWRQGTCLSKMSGMQWLQIIGWRSMNVEVYSRCNETFCVTETISCRPSIPLRSYGVDLRNRRCDCRRFQTFHYPCAHVVAACAKVSFNEVPPTTFELVPNKGLHRNPKGRPQSFRIRNEIEIREKSDGKLCGVCRLAGHNRSKCPLQNYHIGQSLRSDRN